MVMVKTSSNIEEARGASIAVPQQASDGSAALSTDGRSTFGASEVQEIFGRTVFGRTVRLLIDARKLGDGGIGAYLDRLLTSLTQIPELNITVIVRDRMYELCAWSKSVSAIVDASPRYSLDEMFFLSKRIDFAKFDLFHEPHYTLPFGIPIPTVVTVHDFIHLTHPQKAFYPWIARPLLASALRRATRVVAVSRSTAEQARKLFGGIAGLSDKIAVVPNMLGGTRRAPDQNQLQADPDTSSASAERFLLSVVSTSKPHKGLADLLRAWAAVCHSRESELRAKARALKLYLVGYGVEPNSLRLELHRLNILDYVRPLGPVSELDLARYHSQAVAVVVPSLAEGFCLPALESQLNGVPVVMRPVPALLELATPHDFVSEDFSINALVDALTAAICAESRVGANRGSPELVRHLEQYQPDVVVTKLCQVYRAALGIGD